MYKVILADDSALSISGLEANLDFDSIGAVRVGSFLSGMDVLSYLRQHNDVDLLVSDIRMPHMTGLELAREAQAIVPHIKIILISAYDDFEYAQEALRIGVSDYVQKPIQYDVLLSAMEKALRQLENEQRVLRRLQEILPEMRRTFYQDLTRTHPLLAEQTLSNQAKYLGIDISGGAFLCFAVAWENDQTTEPMQKLLLHRLAQSETLQNWMSASLKCHLVQEQDGLLAILHDPGCKPSDFPGKVKALCSEFLNREGHLDAGLCIGIGSASETLWDIPLSIDAAHRALNRRFIRPDQSIFSHEEASEGTLSFLTRFTDSQSEITQLLLRKDNQALQKMVKRMAAQLVKQLKDERLITPYLAVLCSGLLGQLHQEGVDLSAAERMLSGLRVRCNHSAAAQDIENFLNSFLKHIMDTLSQSQQSYQQKVITSVKTYIDDHLSDTQLRLEAIAEEVHVSPSHLSRIFKRSEDIAVSDYITMKRIEKAKHLLSGTSDPISFVSDQVGYASPYYFSACFKRITGKTPSEYRRGQ